MIILATNTEYMQSVCRKHRRLGEQQNVKEYKVKSQNDSINSSQQPAAVQAVQFLYARELFLSLTRFFANE